MTNEGGDLAIGLTLTFSNVSLGLAVFHALRTDRDEMSLQELYQKQDGSGGIEDEPDVVVEDPEIFDGETSYVEMTAVPIENPMFNAERASQAVVDTPPHEGSEESKMGAEGRVFEVDVKAEAETELEVEVRSLKAQLNVAKGCSS